MNKLKCYVTNCLHHSNSLCKLNSIQIEGPGANNKDQTCCSSFFDSSVGSQNSVSHSNTMQANEATNIKCKASSCVHNKSKKCQAIDVEVYEMCNNPKVMSETACQTFSSR